MDFFSGRSQQICINFLISIGVLFVLSASQDVLANPVDDLQERLERLRPYETDEVLWLARCIYSESNRAHEQRLVAWAVRNRVDSKYRGATYRDVILEPLQFSAFNTSSPRRKYILGLNQSSTYKPWLQALEIALDVYQADPIDRPFSIYTRHFYSPVSMAGNRAPAWAKGATPLDSEALGVDPDRFLFFEEIDESADPFFAKKSTPQDRIDTFQAGARERLKPTTTRKKVPLRERMKPSGRVPRPARPRARSVRQK